VLGLSGQLLSKTLFPSPASFGLGETEVSSWLLDTWRVSKRLQFTLGLRQDWYRRINSLAWSPRLGFSWSPFASPHTTISGGYSLTHDAITLGMLGQPLDQTAVTTQYNANGTPIGPPSLSTFTIGNAPLVLPRATNWTLAVNHEISSRVCVTAKYLRRSATDGFAFLNTLAPNAAPSLLPLPDADAAGIYQLTNLRRDDYDSVQVSVHQTLSGQYEWMASYTRSRALSNGVLDPNTAQPLQVLANALPMPWDAPNRLLAWAYLPLPWKNWAISVLADMRSGFPFSVRDETGVIVGAVDSYRYPMNFDLNIAIERMVTLRGHRFALRGGMENLTDQANAAAVNNVTGTPQFLQFLGDEGRHFVVRIRFFGRANTK
jgi:outer membrane receptor for ferrienterochelin and colicin